MHPINTTSMRPVLACVTMLALSLAVASTSVEAQLSSSDRQAMIDLYEATNGDEWRNNDNWLDEPGTECDWFGIECFDDSSDYALVLHNNALSGSLPTSLGDAEGLRALLAQNNGLTGEWRIAEGGLPNILEINLGNNQLTGIELAADAAPTLVFLRLSDNELAGDLPQSLQARSMLDHLDLSHNRLSGELPDWLADLELGWLGLSGNEFTGSILPALAAMEEGLSPGNPNNVNSGVLLDLRANLFAGDIEAEAVEFSQGIDDWLTLCWNDLQTSDASVQAWLEEEHFGDYEQCLGETVEEPELTDSGSWYHPERPGEGFSIMQLDDGQTMVHWFTFAPAEDPPRRQSWLTGSRTLEHPGFGRVQVFGPGGGQFANGLPDPSSYLHDVIGDIGLAWTDEQQLQSDQQIATAATESPISQHLDLVQLSRLAGTSCDNQSNLQEYSGAWYSPERSGEGFVLEVLPDDSAVVYWFTYSPDDAGRQAWIVGSGEPPSSGVVIGTPPPGHPVATLEFDAMARPVGTAFGPDFDGSEIDYIDWGSVWLEFYDDGTGRVSWESHIEEYGSGEYPIERLAQPKLAECD